MAQAASGCEAEVRRIMNESVKAEAEAMRVAGYAGKRPTVMCGFRVVQSRWPVRPGSMEWRKLLHETFRPSDHVNGFALARAGTD